MEPIANPHDRFFKETWSRKKTARDFLRHYLPPELVELIDLKTLKICKDTFVRGDLKEYFSEFLYKVSFGGRGGYVYLLFEHKSHPEMLISLQLLSYIQAIWDLHRKQHGSPLPLPVIVPLVLYHGRKRWSASNDLISLLSPVDPRLTIYVPDFRYILYDLSQFSDDEIKGAVLLRVALLLLKHAFRPDFSEKLPGIFSLLRALLEKETGMPYIETVIRYVLSTIENVTPETLRHMVSEALSPEKGEIVMTIAEKLKNEGRLEGRLDERLEGIELCLSMKFGEQGLKLMDEIRKTNDLDRLKAIQKEILKAQKFSELESVIKA